jgi:DNA-directed RNA polymerase subunit E'
MLTYKPKLQEIVEGEFKEIAEFGAFISIGPIDGLVHVSQIMEDFVNYNEKEQQFDGKETKRNLKLGDKVRARVVTISKKSTLLDTKIGLTMRQPGLGSLDWLDADAKNPKNPKAAKADTKKDEKKESKK